MNAAASAPTSHETAQTATGALPPPPRRSTWTFRQNIVRVLWSTLGRPAWAILPPLRPALIRLFGGKVGPGCRFGRGVDIIIPWNVELGRNVQVGDRAMLYSLGYITIGDDVVIDYKAHLCAGSHDASDPRFPLLTPPITIGSGSFIGIDAFIGPGVTLGRGCRVWPRASVYRNFPDNTALCGNPAQSVSADNTAPSIQARGGP